MYLKNNNLFKLYLSILVILLLCFVFIACDSNKEAEYNFTQYEFPHQQEDIEEVLKQNNLLWTLSMSKSKSDGHTYYLLANKQDIDVCSIESSNDNQGKYLELRGFPPVGKVVSIYEKEWQDVFKLVFTLYGKPQHSQTIYNEFENYIRNKEDSEIRYWRKRIDENTHITINFFLRDSTEKYSLHNIILMDNNSFEALLNSREKIWTNILNKNQIESIGSLSISELTSLKIRDVDSIKGVIVKGYLEDIHELKDNKIIPKNKLLSYNETFLSALLVDDTGSIPVILRSTSLNKEELGEVRKHYIFNINNINIINFSVR